jgi:hypothetical protein
MSEIKYCNSCGLPQCCGCNEYIKEDLKMHLEDAWNDFDSLKYKLELAKNEIDKLKYELSCHKIIKKMRKERPFDDE